MRKVALFLIAVLLVLPVASAIEYTLDVGHRITIDNKQVTLSNVGSGGAIVVDVEGSMMTIAATSKQTINGIIVGNVETFYADAKEERSAILDLSFSDAESLCSNGVKDSRTLENGIDCEGFCEIACPTCNDRIKNQDESDIDCGGVCDDCSYMKTCNKDSDCQSDDCSDTKWCCAEIGEPKCNGKLISKAKAKNGCSLGYSCCGDNVCESEENIDNCVVDCCKGCLDLSRNCLGIGERKEPFYCSKNKTLGVQKSDTDSCVYDYECLSGLCLIRRCRVIESKDNEKQKEQIVKQEEKQISKKIEVKKETKTEENPVVKEVKTREKEDNGFLKPLFNWFVGLFS